MPQTANTIRLLLFACMLGMFHAYGEFTHEVGENLADNPIAWAKPLAGGPIRALFIAPRFTLGDVAQLAARLDLQYETVALWDADNMGYDPMAHASLPEGGSREEALKRIHAGLKKRLDVIVLGNFDTDILPEELLSAILDKVASGTGLVIAHPRNSADSPLYLILDALTAAEDELPLWHGVGECAFPGGGTLEGDGLLRTHGKGRIGLLQYPGEPPRHHCLIQPPADPWDMDALYEENAYVLAARAICAAAGRLGGVRIAALRDVAPLGPQEDEIPPDLYPEFVQALRDSVVAQPSRPFQFTLNKPADQRYSVRAQLRRADSDVQIVWHDPDLLPRGATSHQFEIPVGSGAYTFDVWLYTRSGVADWFSTDLVLPGWPEFTNLELEKTWLLPNDSLEATLDVRPVANQTRQATIYARAVDGYGRVVSETSAGVSHQGGQAALRMHFSDLLSALIKLEVFALEGPVRLYSEWELHSAYREVRYLSVRQRPGPDTLELVVSATEPREYAALHYFRRLAKLGATWLHAPADEATIVLAAQQQLRLLPQVDRAAAMNVRDNLYREPCLTNPVFRGENKDALRDATLRHWAGGFGRYSLGDGQVLSEVSPYVCQCRHCMSAFQRMLAAEYGNVTALNEAWRSDFPDWDFVELSAPFGPGEGGAPAPWVDFRRFTDIAFAEYHAWARRETRNADNSALVGARFTADARAARAYFWPALFDALDFVAADYSPLMIDKTRSYSRPGAWSGTALQHKNALAAPEIYDWLPWRLALDGIRSLWLDTAFGDAQHPAPNAWLLPDGAATEALTRLAGAVDKLGDTVGPLLYAATPETPEIAIYDSHASRHLAEVDAVYNASMADAQQAAAAMMRLAGTHFVFMDRSRLLDASVDNCKAIILPLCRALDNEEQAALQRYVASGGALIADVVPGECDVHGRQGTDYALGDLFGIAITGAPVIQAGALTAVEDVAVADSASSSGLLETSEQDAAVRGASRKRMGTVPANTSVVLEGGVALAEMSDTPAWIVNRWGEGYTLLLNHPFRPVVHEKGRRLVPHEYHGITAFIGDLPGMERHTGQETFLGVVNHYRFGDAHIYAVLSDYDVPRQRVPLPLERNDTVYNALTGERVSRPHRARFQLTAGQPLVITVLPQPVAELFVHAPEMVYVGQRLPIRLEAQTASGSAGKHLFIVDLAPLNGEPIPWYRQMVTGERGVCEVVIPLARNEILGRYTLRVRDALTGLETSVPITLSSPAN